MINTIKNYSLKEINSGNIFMGPVYGILKDSSRNEWNEKGNLLERYKHDIYSVFLGRLNDYIMSGMAVEKDGDRLRELLEEIIKIQTLLEESQNE
ncbi:MAG: hypothetical protein NTV72_01120 [Candidatus Taylorbacteria bacterium]|nr:hypothetical protein [Candidatus Taylorbacteria bacterium]